jgi:hypothetical protein
VALFIGLFSPTRAQQDYASDSIFNRSLPDFWLGFVDGFLKNSKKGGKFPCCTGAGKKARHWAGWAIAGLCTAPGGKASAGYRLG